MCKSINVQSFENKWLEHEFDDWGGITSPEYKEFQKEYKTLLSNIASENGFSLHAFNGNHYDFSAVLKNNSSDKFYYISISDVRYWKNHWDSHILYRSMKHEKDWTGGPNAYSSLKDLGANLKKLDNWEVDRCRKNELEN